MILSQQKHLFVHVHVSKVILSWHIEITLNHTTNNMILNHSGSINAFVLSQQIVCKQNYDNEFLFYEEVNFLSLWSVRHGPFVCLYAVLRNRKTSADDGVSLFQIKRKITHRHRHRRSLPNGDYVQSQACEAMTKPKLWPLMRRWKIIRIYRCFRLIISIWRSRFYHAKTTSV